MKAYLNLVQQILDKGEERPNRTGVGTLALPSTVIEHDMAEGFPLLTTKKMPFKVIAVELEGFIQGITDKKWYQERGCHIWDEWCNPQVVPYGHDDETKAKMKAERDLGPVYGYQWRRFNRDFTAVQHMQRRAPLDTSAPLGADPCDQLAYVVEQLKTNPDNRRLIVSAWNPLQQPQMALAPCHFAFQVLAMNGKLHLNWMQRSVDTALGLPFNLASYALLLHLLALETSLVPGRLTGFLGDTHIYENHIEGLRAQLLREPRGLPWLIQLDGGGPFNIFKWKHEGMLVQGYHPHKRIKFEVVV